MTLAALSLAALVLALVLSMVSSVNVGFLALVLAWVVGVYAGGMRADQVLAGFPVSLFLTLVGVTLLFSQAFVNGTLDRLAHRAIRICRGNTGAIPMMFFALTAILSSIGPGNIASTALMAPVGMAAAGRYGIPPFLMAIMIANGASAGSVSPFAPTGIIVDGIAGTIGLTGVQWTIYVNNFLAHAAVAFGGYFLLGGRRLFARRAAAAALAGVGPVASAAEEPDSGPASRGPAYGDASRGPVYGDGSRAADEPGRSSIPADERIEWRHRLTMAVIAGVIVSVIVLHVNVALAALAGAVILTMARAAEETGAVKAMPWQVIMMVSGITMLVALLEKTGGLDLFTAFLARFTTPATSTAVAAFVTGIVSIYSSTTGVVLPALLPTIPGLIRHVGGGDPMALLSSMVVGGHLVDVSPLSTLGALCLAAAPAGTDTKRMFNQLLVWGASMSVVGALVCWVFFGLL
jgi:di/tricarboxylate transporter